MLMPKFHGNIVALITPIKNDRVDFDTLHKLVCYHIDCGTDAIVIAGTTGESATLSNAEKIEMVKQAVNFANKEITIIAGTGSNCTREAIQLTKLLQDSGVDGCLSVTPYYNKPTQQGLYLHYKAIAESTDLPQILYNVPSRTGSDLCPETVGRLAEIENIIGIKDATGDLTRLDQIKKFAGEDFIFLSGDDETALEAMKQGADGVISVASNIVPRKITKMCKAATSDQFEIADEIQNRLLPVFKALFLEPNPIVVKWAAFEMGLIDHLELRLPLTKILPKTKEKALEALVQAELITSENLETK